MAGPRPGSGGKRPGAGRPKGRKNSAPPVYRKKRAEAIAAAAAGLTPVEFLLSIMRNEENELTVRADAAARVAPYCHPRLSTIEMSGKLTVSHEERLKQLE